MGTLYISGAQCVHAELKQAEHWDKFDNLAENLGQLANVFNVYVDRRSLNDQGDDGFVVMHNPQNFGEFYSGAALDTDMTVETSDTFEARAAAFIEALNKDKAFSDFHNLQWSKPRVLYFVSS